MSYSNRLLLILCCLLPFSAYAQDRLDVTGKWKTIDDETGKAKSIVEVYVEDEKVYGKVVDLLLKPDDTVCSKCKDELKDKPVVGMVILSGLEKKGDVYKGGKILDPAKGKFYKAKLWRDGDKLQVRGYIGFFFRTQTWEPAE